MKYYKITWIDHFPLPDWSTKKEIKEWALRKKKECCVTVGTISYEDDDVIVLSASFDGDDSFGDSLAIRKSDIIKKKRIVV